MESTLAPATWVDNRYSDITIHNFRGKTTKLFFFFCPFAIHDTFFREGESANQDLELYNLDWLEPLQGGVDQVPPPSACGHHLVHGRGGYDYAVTVRLLSLCVLFDSAV